MWLQGLKGTLEALEEKIPFTSLYLTDRATVWGNLTDIFADSTAWTYCKVGKRHHNDRKGYLSLYDHFLGPNNVYHTESAAKKILHNKVYHGKQNNKTFERYVTIQKDHNTILENLKTMDTKVLMSP